MMAFPHLDLTFHEHVHLLADLVLLYNYLLRGDMYAEFRPRIIILKYMPRLINYSGEHVCII